LASTVFRAGTATNKTGLFHAVNQPRGAVLGQQQPIFQLNGSQHTVRLAREFEQHVIPGEWGQAGLFQIALDPGHRRMLGAYQPRPSLNDRVVGLFGHLVRITVSCNRINLDIFMQVH
jgi:hypothetical protein